MVLKLSVRVFVCFAGEKIMASAVLSKAVADPQWFRATDLEASGPFRSQG